ncbi:MAG: hypothetical protein ABIP68_03560, partial [Ferruginibacter sp.]
MKIILLIILFFCYSVANSQTIYGVVNNDEGHPLISASISIRKVSNKIVINFTTTEKDGSFKLKWPDSQDSLELKISYIGYTEFIILLPMQIVDSISFKIKMTKSSNQLPGVTINSQTTWKRGDTTYFKVDAYKDGNERKLDDVIDKLPGFTKDEEGNLKFNGKTVEKITIDGEDLFADKVGLLLKNVPFGVIENIQALEKQTDKPLLKGLDNNQKVFINLQLKKNKISSTIGDWESGLDTKGRYLVNAVIFSLAGKTKAGLINNFNSQGNGIGYSLERELKLLPSQTAEEWLPSGEYLNTIQSLPNRYYINNRQWDCRLKINHPFKNSVKSQTEINFLNDRQIQFTNQNEIILNDSIFTERYTSSNYTRSPFLLQMNQKLTFAIDKLREANVTAYYYGNFSKGAYKTNLTQLNYNDSIATKTKNKYNQLIISADYIHRMSAKSALVAEVVFSTGTFRQDAYGYSIHYPDAFDFYAPGANQLLLPSVLKQTSIAGSLNLFSRKKSLFKNNGLKMHSDVYELNSTSTLANSYDPTIKYFLPQYSGMGNYTNYGVNGFTGIDFKVLKSTLFLNLSYGYEGYKKTEEGKKEKLNAFIYRIDLKYKFRKSSLQDELSFSYYNSLPKLFAFRELARPTSVNKYAFYKLPLRTSQNLEANYRYPFKFNRHIFIASVSSKLSSSGNVSRYNLNKLLQTNVDSVINVPSLFFMASLNYSHASLPLKMLVNFDVFAFLNKHRFLTDTKSGNFSSQSIISNLSLKRNWNRKYFIIAKGDL